MRILATLLAASALCLGASRTHGDDDKAKKLRDAIRKLQPSEEYEIARKKRNDELIVLLGKAEKMELFRLDPKGGNDAKKEQKPLFLKYEITLRVAVDNADQRKALVTELGKEFHWYEGWKKLCFSPRHGLRVTQGKDTLELLICLECSRMRFYKNDELIEEIVLLGEKWEAAEKLFQEAEQRAKKAEKK